LNRKTSPSKVSHERWLVSYADFITLLFAFFVVLYAFAKADEKKQAQVSAAIDEAFRVLSIAPASHWLAATGRVSQSVSVLQPGIAAGPLVPAAKVQTDLEHIRRDLQQRLALQIANRTVFIQLGRDGLVISLREAGFFDSGSAIPKPDTTPTLSEIAAALRDTPYDVRVEGHTDNVPIHNAEFDSNWELSSARAVRIARMFLEMRAIRPQQISAAGFAEYRPIADNNTADGRAENRRVDIVVMPRAVLDISAPEATQDRSGWRRITKP
jgi:chemotaxis protein MotB